MTSFRALIVRDAVIATMLPLAALTLFLLRDQDQAGREALDRSLLIETTTASSLLADLPDERLQPEVRKLDRNLGVRLTVIRKDGTVIADTHAEPSRMEDHAGRVEVSEALLNGLGKAEHHSATLGREMRYLAIARPSAGGLRVYRGAGPVAQLESRIRRTQLTLIAAAIAVLIFSLLLSARLV